MVLLIFQILFFGTLVFLNFTKVVECLFFGIFKVPIDTHSWEWVLEYAGIIHAVKCGQNDILVKLSKAFIKSDI
jgi:hypothetical protein